MPELRQDLRLFPAAAAGGGQGCVVYDPVRHRYFQLARSGFDLVSRWRAEPAAQFAKRIEAELDRPVSVREVNEVAKFIIANELALEPPQGDARNLAARQARLQKWQVSRVIHGYLFFRVPLIRPERFLNATLPLVAPLYSRAAAVIIIVISLCGLYLASRQWEQFIVTFLDFFSLQGVFAYLLAIVLVKSMHELGHAYTATRAGVRVNTMGVAFIVLAPMLYTDVSDAWRLPGRRQKLAIDGAGVVVELALAGVAMFLWAFLPDGPWRSAAFVTATTSLFIGLIINLNPLMRFDGYYLLSDAWGIPNLQPRSNALARWWLREFLFELRRLPPEPLPTRRRTLMIVFAMCAWVYRFFVFLGIALVVYHMFFKVLGIILFAVEIIWFILLPVFNEVREWWKLRSLIRKSRRALGTAAVVALLIAVLVVPWRTSVVVQGVALRDRETLIYAPRSSRVQFAEIADRQRVSAGDTLLILSAPDLEHEVRKTRLLIQLTERRLDRIAGDTRDLSQRVVLEGELSRHVTNLAGLREELRRLHIRSPHAGTLRDVDRDLGKGQWVDDATPFARVVASTPTEARCYVSEEDIGRLAPGGRATFIPEDPLMPRQSGSIIEVSGTGSRAIELPYLASVFGGAVAADRDQGGEIKPRSGHHRVRVALYGPPVKRAVRGTLHLSAASESIASVIWRRVLKVLVRESSA